MYASGLSARTPCSSETSAMISVSKSAGETGTVLVWNSEEICDDNAREGDGVRAKIHSIRCSKLVHLLVRETPA